jgi:non-canonical poly(A) RNA polymerase PAPD5/7
MSKSNRSSSSDQSESMGRSDDEAAIGNEADTSFLDDDFLSFEKDTEKSGRERRRSNSPVPYGQNSNNRKQSIPWLDESSTPTQQPRQQYNQNRGRGYGGNNNFEVTNLPYYEPSALTKLHNEIVSFVKLMEPTNEELEIRDKMVERVTNLANRVFGEGKVSSFYQSFTLVLS